MKLEYDYTIGPEGIRFSLIEDQKDDIAFEGSQEDRLSVQRFIMASWEEAINKTSSGPDEIRELMATEEGQQKLRQRAEHYLMKLLENFPPELDRRRGEAASHWDNNKDRRRRSTAKP